MINKNPVDGSLPSKAIFLRFGDFLKLFYKRPMGKFFAPAFLFAFFLSGPLFAAESPSIGVLKVFPANNPWHWDVSSNELHPNSDNFINSIGAGANLHPDFGTVWNGAPIGIPYALVDGKEPKIPVTYTAYGDESDPGPFPIPLNAPIEGGPSATGDRHAKFPVKLFLFIFIIEKSPVLYLGLGSRNKRKFLNENRIIENYPKN